MKIAVEGCCHGELDAIYQTLELLQQKNNITVDLLLICGDFQSVRNTADMQCMAVSPKYRQMNTFYKYYSGEKVAPVLTVFIGGNHEASNYLQELPYGGWVAPKIYYMGYANVVQFGGIRIGGISGIYKGKDYMKGHFEHPPYNTNTIRSAYHVRNLEVFRLKQLRQHVDMFISHDWPKGIHKYGDVNKLLKRKAFLRDEVEKDALGNPAAAELLSALQPTYWFSAHLHVKFPAVVKHSTAKVTKFLSLDKCLPRRHFLQVVDVPHDSSKPMKLQLDPEWLAILKSTNHLLSVTETICYLGGQDGERKDFTASESEIKSIVDDFGGNLAIPDNFERTVPAYDANKGKKQNQLPPAMTEINPQTTLLCSMLDLTNPNAVFLEKDSSYRLPDDAELHAAADGSKGGCSDGDDINDDDDDIQSERSFMSVSGSEQSFSDKSFSFISAGNDSIMSTGSPNESLVSFGNPDDKLGGGSSKEQGMDSSMGSKSLSVNLPVSCERNSEKLKLAHASSTPISVQKLASSDKRLSLSEKLKRVKSTDSIGETSGELDTRDCSKKLDMNIGTGGTSGVTRTDIADEDPAIIVAGKLDKSISSTTSSDGNSGILRTDSDIDIKSSSSIDTLEISDDDPELREMLVAQRTLSGSNLVGLVSTSASVSSDNGGRSCNRNETDQNISIEMASQGSVDDDDLEMADILAAQKKNRLSIDNKAGGDYDRDLDIPTPINQSSPIASAESKLAPSDTSPGSGQKRLDQEKRDEGKSPAVKKFKRRNQDMYVAENGDV